MKQYASRALALVRRLWAKEPARVVSGVAAVAVFVCAKIGVVVPAESITSAVAFALPLLLGGELIRSQVTPVSTVPKP